MMSIPLLLRSLCACSRPLVTPVCCCRFGSPAKAVADPEEGRKLDEIKTMVAMVAGQLSARPVPISPVQDPFTSPGEMHHIHPKPINQGQSHISISPWTLVIHAHAPACVTVYVELLACGSRGTPGTFLHGNLLQRGHEPCTGVKVTHNIAFQEWLYLQSLWQRRAQIRYSLSQAKLTSAHCTPSRWWANRGCGAQHRCADKWDPGDSRGLSFHGQWGR